MFPLGDFLAIAEFAGVPVAAASGLPPARPATPTHLSLLLAPGAGRLGQPPPRPPLHREE